MVSTGDSGGTEDDDETLPNPTTLPPGTVSTTGPGTTAPPQETTDSPDESSGGSSTGGPASVCGNGIVEDGEECDDDEVRCRADCLLACNFISVTEIRDDVDPVLQLGDVAIGPGGTAIVVGTRSPNAAVTGEAILARIANNETVLGIDSLGPGFATAVHVNDDGSAYVAGQELVESEYEGWVRLVDDAGDVAWTHAPDEGREGASTATGVAAMPGGGAVVSGWLGWGTGDSDLFVARYGPQGHIWTEPFSSTSVETPSNDRSGAVFADPLGAVYAIGYAPSELGGLGARDPILASFGPEGGEALWDWTTYVGSTNVDLVPAAVAIDGGGDVLALFALWHNSQSSAHFMLYRFSAAGEMLSEFDSETLAVPGGDIASALLVDEAGRVIITGSRGGFEAGDDNGMAWVLAFDEAGDIVCNEIAEESLGSQAAAAFTDDGNIVTAGTVVSGFEDAYGVVARFRGF